MSSFKEKFAEYIRFTEDNLRKYNAPADGETAQKDYYKRNELFS